MTVGDILTATVVWPMLKGCTPCEMSLPVSRGLQLFVQSRTHTQQTQLFPHPHSLVIAQIVWLYIERPMQKACILASIRHTRSRHVRVLAYLAQAILAEVAEGPRIAELAWGTTADWAWTHVVHWTKPGWQPPLTNVRHTKRSLEIQRLHEGDTPIQAAHQGVQQQPFSLILPRCTPRQNGGHKGTIKRLHSNPCETCLTAREHGRYA